MGEETSQTIYKLRAQTAEWVNALCCNFRLQQMPVRGFDEVPNRGDAVRDHT